MKVFTYIKDHSNRVYEKNFRKIGHLELWKHLIYELKGFDVFIDTDSNRVINDCASLSYVTAYRRDKKFIDIENDPKNKISPALLMVDNFLNLYVTDENEPIVVTHVTSPFLKKETINKAVSYLDNYNFVHSIHSIQDFAWISNNFNPLNFDPNIVQRTQDVEKIHFSSGAFFIFTKKTFKKYNTRLGPNTFYFNLNHLEAIEIDTDEDLEFARTIYKGMV
jgi:CMP-N-acetylneuraminic acid synthetase